MNLKQFSLKPFVLITALALLLGALLASNRIADASPEASTLSWDVVRVDGGANDVGLHPSIAVKPENKGAFSGMPFVTYYDASSQHLRLAYYMGPGQGTCLNGWQCYNADNSAQTGRYSALAFDSTGKGIVGYTNEVGLDTLEKYEIDPDLTPHKFSWIGSGANQIRNVSVVMGYNDYPNLAFYENSILPQYDSASSAVRYRSWNYDMLSVNGVVEGATPPSTGYFASAGYSPFSNREAFAYRGHGTDIFPLVDTLNYHDITNNTHQLIDSVPGTGNYISLYMPQKQGEAVQIAYYDATNKQLKFAKSTSAQTACGIAGVAETHWTCEGIETIGSDNFKLGISLGMVNGSPVIAYTDRDDQANSVLKLARYVGSGGTGCNKSTKWTCTIVDDGDWYGQASIDNVGLYTSLTVGPDGRIYIAEHDADAGDLKVAIQRADQTISFSPLANHTLGTPPFTVSATATSGLPVSFTASGPCTATGNNGTKITMTGVGKCSVTAHQGGNNYWRFAGNVVRSFQITQPAPPPPPPTAVPTSVPAGCDKAPGKPNGLIPGNKTTVASGKMILSWNGTNCTDEYKMVLKKIVLKNGKHTKHLIAKNTGPATSYKVQSMLKSGKYLLTVKACNSKGCGDAGKSKFKAAKP